MGPEPVVDCLFDRLPDIVFFAKDRHGRYQRVNSTLVARCGLKHKEDLVGHTAAEVFPDGLGSAYLAQDQEVLSTGVPIEGKLELHVYPGGHEGWCLTYKMPVRGPSGAIVGLMGISRDVHRPDECHPEYARLAKAIEALRLEYGATVRLEALARTVGLSMGRFEHLVEQIFHLTPRHLLIKTRIEAASRLLLDESLPIVVIAKACGYADHSAFTRQFRATVGLTPRAFRARRRDSA